MTKLISGYVARTTSSNQNGKTTCGATMRNWWLVKWNTSGSGGYVKLGHVTLPADYVGKRVRFKVEVIEE